MAIINKFLISIHTSEFGWDKYESKREPVIKDGWMNIFLSDGNVFVNMQKVNKYYIKFEEEKE